MKVAVIGPGAIGSLLAVALIEAGAAATVVARTERVDMVRGTGLTLQKAQGRAVQHRPLVIGVDGLDAGFDWVLVCVKAYAVPELAPALGGAARGGARIAFVQNGLPWWYAERRFGGLDSLDPGRVLASSVPMEQTVGAVAYANARNLGPGRTQHVGDGTFVFGPAHGTPNGALSELCAALAAGGLEPRSTDWIEREIWLKLWGNLAFNPISALTGATMDRIVADPATRPIVTALMDEALAIMRALGIDPGLSIEERLAVAAQAGAFKTSMLQDLEAGRPLEVDAIVSSVAEAADRLGVAAPTTGTVLGLLRQRAATAAAGTAAAAG